MLGFVLNPEWHLMVLTVFRTSTLIGALRAAKGRKEISGKVFVITQAEEET